MRKVTFTMSDEDWKSTEDKIGSGKKYISITDFMNDSVRYNLSRLKRKNGDNRVKA